MQLAIFWIYALVLFINIRLGALEVQANATSFIASPISKPSPTDVSTMEITSSHVTLSRSSSSPYTASIEANASAISPTDSAKNVSTLILQSNNSVTSVVATTSVTSAQANESVTSTQMFNRSVTINTTYVVQSTAVTPTLIAAPTLSLSTSYSTMTTNVTKSEPSSVTPDMTTSESPGVTPGVTISEPSRVTPSVTPTNVTLSTVSLNITTTIPPTTAQLQAPNIESPSQKVVELEKGKMLNLSCKATGNPKPTISWEKDNNAIKNGSLLVIKNIRPSDDGKYTCMAKNTIGDDKITIDVKVLCKKINHFDCVQCLL
ncbi:hemicentin-1 [Exaiptasia diaphana]|uniref:Ig-like domain-containing protein n=1 Tax=Exaiptasia diaphana TaxID=2652724 RepID=A0A913XYK7_EXADI|nr:hemicentin-1 [Exaiptasia diaphana]